MSAKLGIALIALLSIGLAACGEDGDGEGPVPMFESLHRIKLDNCQIRAGGYAVRISGLSCGRTGEILARGGPLRVTEKSGAFDLGNGWTCWADLLKEYGPIQNVCWRGEALIVYKVA
jgi:hypothetical protein